MIDDNPQRQKFVARILRHRSSHAASAGAAFENWWSDDPT